MKLKLNLKRLPKVDFTVLADCGDLSVYNYEQFSIVLKKWTKNIKEGNGYFDANWEDPTTRITIRYNNANGKFIQIIEEEWKPFKMIFLRYPNIIGIKQSGI